MGEGASRRHRLHARLGARFSRSSRSRESCVKWRAARGRRRSRSLHGLQQEARDERDQIGIAAALAQPVQRALDLTHAGADGGQRVGDGVLGVVMCSGCRGARPAHAAPPRRRCVRPRAAACRHWCRRARSSARRRLPPLSGIAARRRGWPCSRRRNARHRTAPRLSPPRRRSISPISARFSLERNAERQSDMEIPALADEAGALRLGVAAPGKTGIVGGAATRALGHAESDELGAREHGRRRRRRRRRSDWRPATRPRYSRCRCGRARARSPCLSCDAEIDALRLRSVAQRRVEEIKALAGHARLFEGPSAWPPPSLPSPSTGDGRICLRRASSRQVRKNPLPA